MISPSVVRLRELVHVPTGTDHPYDGSVAERRPRYPVGGDMVSVGFVSRPGGAAASVRLDWERNGQSQAPIFARATTTGADEDVWLVELGVVEGGDRVTYCITATDHDGGQIVSPDHGFGAETVHRLAGLRTPDGPGSASVMVDADGREGPTIVVEPGDDGTVSLRFGGPARTVSATDTAMRAGDPIPPVTVAAPSEVVRLDPATGHLSIRTAAGTVGPVRLRWYTTADGQLSRVELTGPLADDEVLVGFGERFDALDQRGRAPGMAVYEQYKNQGNRTYFPVPFFLSSAGYGLLIEGTAPTAFDLGRTVDGHWRCLADVPQSRGELAVVVFTGQPAAIVGALTARIGRPEPPPAWAFGPWMSSNEWNTQARVEQEVALTHEHGIPATVVVIEAWSDETTFYVWNGAGYDPVSGGNMLDLADFRFPADGPWPDPKGMTDALHAAGIRLVLWQIPVLKAIDGIHAQHDADVRHATEHEFVFTEADGTPYRNPAFWFRDALVPDLADDEVANWWLGKRRYLVDEIGIDGFKTDGGEHLSGRGLVGRDGRRGDEAVNGFPNAYIGAYHRFVQASRNGDGITFSRAGYTGAGAWPAHWAGDENSTWQAFRSSIVAGLSAGLSGVPFWGWDIGGFSDAMPSADLYLCATAMAAFCPIMQYHSEYNPDGPSRDRTPWNVARTSGDDRVIPVSRYWHRLRMALLPYIIEEAAHAAATGEPMMRALLLDYPDDPVAWRIADQYRFGRDLLIAPVVAPGALERRLYLPTGRWYGMFDGMKHEGGQWVTVRASLDRIPVFVREGSCLPFHLPPGGSLGDDVGNRIAPELGISWHVFPGETPHERTFSTLAGGDAQVQMVPTEAGVAVVVTGAHGPTEVVLPDGRRLAPDDEGRVWFERL